jgi:hypothetical protein
MLNTLVDFEIFHYRIKIYLMSNVELNGEFTIKQPFHIITSA